MDTIAHFLDSRKFIQTFERPRGRLFIFLCVLPTVVLVLLYSIRYNAVVTIGQKMLIFLVVSAIWWMFGNLYLKSREFDWKAKVPSDVVCNRIFELRYCNDEFDESK